ncbi:MULTISPECIES: discoidin domain-containing protein [unclassified Streptomyces]|uniref:discoidin domain-containing protein n=1 Tax=unclassified Streptomyces TaxID=2593676 RepID=UPI000B881A98|nr:MULTISPECIES: discoidin domain-containing protein [unclassified Streptomyces]MYR27551.1 family 16 glycosylhydrolase [Streptomyces sp. SID4945]
MTTRTRSRRRTLPRGVLAVLAAVALLFSLAVVTAPGRAVAAAPVLVSQGKPATASSQEGPFTAASAVDGDNGTRWSSEFSDNQWLQVDLGSSTAIGQVVLRWEAAYAKGYQIQVSANGQQWTTIRTTTNGTGGNETLDVSGTGRYVRVLGTQRATQYGYSLWEFQVYSTGGTGGPQPGGDVLLSYGKQGTASTSQNDGTCWLCTPDKAFDRDPASRWATSPEGGWTDPGWIAVDLGANAAIHRVVLQWDPAYAKSYRIDVSDNGTDWRTVYQTTTGKGFKETIPLDTTGRHVRVYGTQRSGEYGYSLWEFQVWGTGGAPTPPPPLPADPNYSKLVFNDDFDGPAGRAPDASKWVPETGPGPNNELEYYTNNKNAALDGAGNLVLEARKEETPGSACPRDPLTGSGTCQYTSARLNTYGKFKFTYGRVEARIKVSGTQGLWPAFWMLGADYFDQGRPWPYTGEIDIMEHVGKEPGTTYSTLHAPAYNGANGFGSPYTLPGGADFAAGFHTFTVDWNSKGMTFRVDGQVMHTVDKDTLEATRGPWVFDHDFFIILNNAVGGDWPGAPDASTRLPQKMSIDYVKVWQ